MISDKTFSGFSFKQFLHEKKLMAARCKTCGALSLPPRAICKECHAQEMEWVELNGQGKLVAYTTIAVGTSAMIKAGYDREHHYCSGIVQLDEGLSISGIILGVDVDNPESIPIGARVKAEFLMDGKEESNNTLLAFRQVEES